jgi:uncharacterized protein YbjT (DUF2867 family)
VRVLVAGSTGFVGRALVQRLVVEGHEVLAMTRRPAGYAGPGTAVAGDVADPASLAASLDGVDAAYYLVHSLDRPDFADQDRAGAAGFADAASRRRVQQVVYLGGLGDDADDLSPHLRSRREVERVLLDGAPTTALRAGIVVGDGGTSWEMLRQLVERLPVMLTPRWVDTRTQPVGLEDAAAFLAGVLGQPGAVGRSYDVGGPEPMTYRDMLGTVSRLLGKRTVVVPIPLLSPGLSSRWLRLVTDVDMPTARALVESLTNEVVVHDRDVERLTGRRAQPFEVVAAAALDARRRRLGGGRAAA